MAIMQRGCDLTRRSLWTGELPGISPPISWTSAGYSGGAPVYVSGIYAVTVTGTNTDDGSRISCYNKTTGASVWGPINLPAGPTTPYGNTWLYGINDTHAICGRPTMASYNTKLYGLVLATGAIGWTSNANLRVVEDWQEQSHLRIDNSGNVFCLGYDDTLPNNSWTTKINGATGAVVWSESLLNRGNATAFTAGICMSSSGSKVFHFAGIDPDPSGSKWLLVAVDAATGLELFHDSYGPMFEGGLVLAATMCYDDHFGERLYAMFVTETGINSSSALSLQRWLVCYQVLPGGFRILWKTQTHNTPSGYLIWTSPPIYPRVDLFGHVYVYDGENKLRQYSPDGVLLYTWDRYDDHISLDRWRDLLTDKTGKLLEYQRTAFGGMRVFDLTVQGPPYPEAWRKDTVASVAGYFTTAPCLSDGAVYVNDNGTLTKYAAPYIDHRPPADDVSP